MTVPDIDPVNKVTLPPDPVVNVGDVGDSRTLMSPPLAVPASAFKPAFNIMASELLLAT